MCARQDDKAKPERKKISELRPVIQARLHARGAPRGRESAIIRKYFEKIEISQSLGAFNIRDPARIYEQAASRRRSINFPAVEWGDGIFESNSGALIGCHLWDSAISHSGWKVTGARRRERLHTG